MHDFFNGKKNLKWTIIYLTNDIIASKYSKLE